MHQPASVRESSLYFDYPTYPFKNPPELQGDTGQHCVVIVGGGPTGLVAALELGLRGVPTTVIEAEQSLSDGSRALCLSRRSMEILSTLGVAKRFADDALHWTRGSSFYRGQVVFELEMPHSGDERYLPMCNLQQAYMELFLVEAATRCPNVEIRWASRVRSIEQSDQRARLTIDTPAGAYDLNAQWVIAADGARSTMRELMGLRLRGTSYEGRYLIADIRLESDYPTERRAWFDPPSNPGSTVLMHKQPHNMWRVDYQLLDQEDASEARDRTRIIARIEEQLAMAGETGAWELDWYSVYKAHCLALDRFRHDRVLFVGDAAHLVPIFGVRGLNSGIADANNLGWKLAAVVHGRAAAGLLDTFSDERTAATAEIFREATKSTAFMTPPSRGYRLMRDAALGLSLTQEWSRPLINPRQSAPYDYVDSELNADDDPEFAGGPGLGAPLFDSPLRDHALRTPSDSVAEPPGCYLLDHLSISEAGAVQVLVFWDDKPVPSNLASTLRELADQAEITFIAPAAAATAAVAKYGTLIEAQPGDRVFTRYDARPGTLYVARPDHHVCARWRRIDAPGSAASRAKLNAIISRASGRLETT